MIGWMRFFWIGSGFEVALFDLPEPPSFVVVFGPQPSDDGEPFLGTGVAILMPRQRHVEHIHFRPSSRRRY